MKALSRNALRRVVAEGNAVDGGEIAGAIDLARSWRAELARFLGRLGNALGRGGVRRHHVGAVGGSARTEARSALHSPSAVRNRAAA